MKLPDHVLEIRRSVLVHGKSVRETAREFFVSTTTVLEMCSDRTRFVPPWPPEIGSVPTYRTLEAREGLRGDRDETPKVTSGPTEDMPAPAAKVPDPWERLGSR